MAEKKPRTSLSIYRKRWRKFKTLKRGWYSFLLLTAAFALSFLNPVLVNNTAFAVRYEGSWRFPLFADHIEAVDLGQRRIGEPKYRLLKEQYAEEGKGNLVFMPPYPYGPIEALINTGEGKQLEGPSAKHWMGLDDRGRDVFARLVYGFRVSLLFALLVVIASYVIGVTVGATLGFFGGKIDIIGQRFVEVWGFIPFLYTVIIISSITTPGFMGLVGLLSIFGWVGISYYIRGEFYREKSKDYVAAAIACGESNASIMFRHVLPNALTPIVSFAPFALVGSIGALVALDFLGFGLPAPTPSWGELVKQGQANITSLHIVLFPLAAFFATLLMVVFIGEAIREAFDPKRFSRLR